MPASLYFFFRETIPLTLEQQSWIGSLGPFGFPQQIIAITKKAPLLLSITSFIKIISLYPDPRAGGLAGSLASVVLGSWPGPRFCFSFFPKSWIQIVLQTWSCHLLNIIPCRLDSRASLL